MCKSWKAAVFQKSINKLIKNRPHPYMKNCTGTVVMEFVKLRRPMFFINRCN